MHFNLDQAFLVATAYFIFSAAVEALEPPSSQSSPTYKWAYRFLHYLAGNWKRAMETRYPSLAGTAVVAAVVTTEATPPKGDTL